MDSINENFGEFHKNVQAVKPIADDTRDTVQKKKQRFPDITSEEADKIAGETIKKRTRKQTIWGVKVFRGNNFLSKILRSE